MGSHRRGLPVTARAAMRSAQTERRAKVRRRLDEEVGGRFYLFLHSILHQCVT